VPDCHVDDKSFVLIDIVENAKITNAKLPWRNVIILLFLPLSSRLPRLMGKLSNNCVEHNLLITLAKWFQIITSTNRKLDVKRHHRFLRQLVWIGN
jgi:hypothetical protein